MKLILEEAEIQAAVKAYMGTDYDIKDLKVVVGRTKSSTRIEVEVERTAQVTHKPVLEVSEPTIKEEAPVEVKKHSGPIFAKLEED